MSEGDFEESSVNDATIKTRDQQRHEEVEDDQGCQNHHKVVLTPTISSSPPRSRSQSAGSTHHEALLFFERHKLFQPDPEEESSLPGIFTEDTSFNFNAGGDPESSEISTFSKSPSPAHYSDIVSSSDDQRNFSSLFYCGNQLDIPQPRARSKSDNLTLLVRQESKKKERFGDDKPQLRGNLETSLHASESITNTNGATNSDKSPQRNRSIRGRSHSQPSQVIVSCVGSGGGFSIDGRGGGSAGESYSGESRKGSKKYSWLEQIQFRVQYQHFRTNDYASVVNSASSLDKAGVPNEGTIRSGPALFQVTGQGPSRGGKSQTPSETGGESNNSSQNSPPIGATNDTKTLTLASGNRNSCWNFPRVKFRRIFNAKSLDDILGRGDPGSRKSSSCVSPETFAPAVSSSCARNAPPGGVIPGASTTSDLDEEPSSSFAPIKSKRNSSSISSLKIYNPNPSGIPSVSSGSIGSGSESGGGGNKSKGKSLVSVFGRIPQFHSSGKETDKSDGKTVKKFRKKGSSSSGGGGGGEKPSKSLSSGSLNRVSAAKSDNYLNRIVVSATCARFSVGKSSDNLATSQSDTHKSQSAIKKKSKRNSNSTIVEAFSTSSNEASGSSSGVEVSNQPQQRRWTAVKHKWDLKLQQQQSQQPPSTSTSLLDSASTSSSTDPSKKPGDAAVFIKSQLSQISGVSNLLGENYEDSQALESCGTIPPNFIQQTEETFPTKPHEAGRVKFCLEPQEIPASPPISRSQSSDCRPIQVDPSLIDILDSNPEEESEEMTKSSRHFHYSTSAGGATSSGGGGSKSSRGGRHHNKDPHRDSSGGAATTNKASSSGGGLLTSKDTKKAQLVVANVSYLQRPTSPCLLISPGDSSSSNPQSSSPIVFSPNNNFGAPAQQQSSSVTSPVQSQLSTYHQTRMMKHEYLSSGSGSIGFLGGGGGGGLGAIRTNNLNERQIKENINKGQAPGGTGGHYSSFVPSCVNRNDVISSPPPPPRGINGSTSNNEPGGANKTITKESKYGSGGDRVGQEQVESHDDTIIYTNRYKDSSRGNKNVMSATFSAFHPGETDPEDQMQSGDFSFDSGCPNLSGDYLGFDNRTPLTHSNLIGDLPQDLLRETDSSQRNNNFQSQDSSEEQEDEMGDLQSPTYVKRTAHMFNSKYSSQMNGSSSTGDPIKENRNPSYLNVSRSVSGYSCLSYNNGVTTTSTTNGSSSCTNGTSPYSHKYVSPTSTKVKSEFTIKVNQPQIGDHHHRMNEDDNDTMNNGDGRLIRSPTSPKSKYHVDESEDTSEPDGTYVPSHGKSFIMQRIERLYGSDAVSSASVFSKSSVSKGGSTTTTTLKCETLFHSPTKGKERVIPIQIENDFERGDEVDRSDVSEKVAKEVGFERLIRGDEMLLTEKSLEAEEEIPSNEDDDALQSPSKSCGMNSAQILNNSSIGNVNSPTVVANKIENGSSDGVEDAMHQEGVSLESCPGKHKLRTISLGEEDKQSIVASAKINNGVHSHDNRPLTSPSPTKKSQPLHEVASQGAISLIVDANKTDDAESNVEEAVSNVSYTTTNESTSKSSSPATMTGNVGAVKDGTYFLNEMNLTKKRLAEYTERYEKEVEKVDQSSELAGNILSAVGKANLLMKKKFKQFEGLCNSNLQGVVGDERVTTNEDLEGFWDMVMIQVEQVYSLFQKLDGVEEPKSEDVTDSNSNPKAKPVSPRKTSSTKLAKPVASKSQTSEAAKARDESRRKMLAERRRLMKNQTQEAATTDQEEVVIFTPENN